MGSNFSMKPIVSKLRQILGKTQIKLQKNEHKQNKQLFTLRKRNKINGTNLSGLSGARHL
jgi:hypothetical protein